jgi:hypothetical protein
MKGETMSKKSDVVDYLKAHPEASNKEVSEALAKKKIEVSPNHVANIKTALKKAGEAPTATKEPKAEKPPKAAKPSVVAVKHVTGFSEVVAVLQEVTGFQVAHGGKGREVITEVKALVEKAGGWDRLEEALVAAQQLATPPIDFEEVKTLGKHKAKAITAQ